MKEFFKKYLILIFLSFLIVILVFLKLTSKNTTTEIIQIVPTPTVIYPDPETVKLEELKKMDYQTLTNYLNQLTEEQINNLPEEQPTDSDISSSSSSLKN